MINITIDNNREFLWLKSVLDAGVLNISKDYLKHLIDKYGVNTGYKVHFRKSNNYIDYSKEENIMANVKTDKFDFLEEIKREGFTQKYTKVYATNEKNFNAFHNYVVANAETGEVVTQIYFQEGPIKENGVNGVSNEDLILMVINRLESFQESEYVCEENAEAITHLMEAIESLRARTNKRIAEGIEGTSAIGGCDSCSIPPITE